MSYAKYAEDNRKIRNERQADYLLYHEDTPHREEYIPYAVRYNLPQQKPVRRRRTVYAFSN